MPNVMAAQPNIGGAVCESAVIPLLVPRRSLADPAAGVPCTNAANIGEGKTWTQSECILRLARFHQGQRPPTMYI